MNPAMPARADLSPALRSLAGRRIGRIAHIRRYREIAGILVKYGLADVVQALHLTRYAAASRRLLSAAGGEVDPAASRSRRIRLAFEALGPTFIKFGQALSTRADLLPPDVLEELTRLQDSVPPLAPGTAERAIERAFGHPVSELFARFEPEPLAAASIAQVHRATLRTGAEVAVKVRRPGIEDVIEADLSILADLAAVAERSIPDATLYNPTGLVDEFARTIRRELDLAREGRIIDRVASQFEGDLTVRYPAIVWPLTTPSVLTMEFLEGVKVSDVGTDAAPDLDPRIVTRRGADAVLKQILVHGLFHADPHPGNILVLPGHVVAFIDWGIVGRLSRRMRDTLADTILAVRRRDADRLAEIVAEVATPLRPVNLAELARDFEEMIDLFGDVPLGELALAEVFSSVTRTMSRHRLKLPADLLLLIKSVSTMEAVGARLDPTFRMVAHAAPMVERLVARRYTPGALASRAAGAGHEALDVLRALPNDLAAIARKARREGLQVQFVHRNFDHFVREMDRSSNRLSFAIVIAAIVVASSIVIHAGAGPAASGYPTLGLAGFLVAAVLGVGLAIGILRSGRL